MPVPLVANTSALPASILVVDDQEIILETLREILGQLGYAVETATSGAVALEKIRAAHAAPRAFDLVVCDIKMPQMTGLELLEEIKKLDSHLPVIVITGFPSIGVAIEAMKKGASDFITKPFDIDLIEHMIARTLRERRLLLENQNLLAKINQKAVIEKLNRDLHNKIDELTKLVMINERLSPLTDNEEVFAETVRLADTITGSERISLMILDRNQNCLRIRAASGLDPEIVRQTRLRVGEGVAGRVAQSCRPVHKREFDTHPECVGGAAGRTYFTSAFLSVPLLIGQELVGVLNMTDKCDRRGFTPTDVMLIQQLSEKAAIRIENNILYEGIYSNLIDTLRSLVVTLEARDSYTSQHSQRVTSYALSIARYLDFDEETQEALKFAGTLHDIGKIGVSDRILLKPGRLSLEEYNVIKTHPATGDIIVEPLGLSQLERQVIRHHHERLDGNGYPDGLKGEAIPLVVRVVSVSDAFDAMTSSRPYRQPMSMDQAFEEMHKHVGTQFDGVVVEALVRCADEGRILVPSSQDVFMVSPLAMKAQPTQPPAPSKPPAEIKTQAIERHAEAARRADAARPE